MTMSEDEKRTRRLQRFQETAPSGPGLVSRGGDTLLRDSPEARWALLRRVDAFLFRGVVDGDGNNGYVGGVHEPYKVRVNTEISNREYHLGDEGLKSGSIDQTWVLLQYRKLREGVISSRDTDQELCRRVFESGGRYFWTHGLISGYLPSLEKILNGESSNGCFDYQWAVSCLCVHLALVEGDIEGAWVLLVRVEGAHCMGPLWVLRRVLDGAARGEWFTVGRALRDLPRQVCASWVEARVRERQLAAIKRAYRCRGKPPSEEEIQNVCDDLEFGRKKEERANEAVNII